MTPRTEIGCWLGLLLMTASTVLADLVNLSSRAVTEVGDNALIAGFVLEGTESEQVLVRAAGPSLEDYGVEGALSRVKLELFRGEELLAENQGWDMADNADEIEALAQTLGAFPFARGSGDAALLMDLPPGAYTAIVTPAPDAQDQGVTLAEVYDSDASNTSRLVNLSARSRVRSASEPLITGFVVNGEGNRILARGIGPALLDFGVQDPLANPNTQVFSGDMVRAEAAGWWSGPDSYEIASRSRNVGAFPLAEQSADAALIMRPDTGGYSIHLSEENGEAGVALAEIYDLRALTALPPVAVFDLVGFARLPSAHLSELTGGGARIGDYDPATMTGNYWKIDAVEAQKPGFAESFRAALRSDDPLIVEINTDLDLSVVALPDLDPTRTAVAHPELIPEGADFGYIGKLDIGSNKTIYSATGTGVLRRGSISLEGASNVMIRNLHFRELWEWDDETNGAFDRNSWDYITVLSRIEGGQVVDRARHIWIDHCDFANAYDGHVDVVLGSDLVTVSWSRFGGGYADTAAAWIETQMDHLEANRERFNYYDLLRRIFSAQDLQTQSRPHFKSSLVGNSSSDASQQQDSGYLNVTYHHNWYHGVQDRMPRLRFGNAHVFNVWADDSPLAGVDRVQRDGVKATADGAAKVENTIFIDVTRPLNNRLFAESRGQVTVVGSLNLDRETGEDKGFNESVTVEPSEFRWNSIAPDTGIPSWPDADSAALPAGYFPDGTNPADYIHAADYLQTRLDHAGVVVPRDAADQETLRRWLQSATPSQL